MPDRVPFLLYNHRLQSFEHLEYSRTHHRVLQCQLRYLNHLLAVRVRILPARFRSVLIHMAIVIVAQKRAW